MPRVTERPREPEPMTGAELAASIGRAHLAFAAAVTMATAEYNETLGDVRSKLGCSRRDKRLTELRRATAAGRKAAVRRARDARDSHIAALRERFDQERASAVAL